ncbi:MAG: hypothetical protein B6U72_07245 [Candidatus Altiarchaeales archaeon ex4484_2]|nr:MAG: hypothetical protein B6U72_07245 [Candidatus Altiarchaeales archaeon ex4484_2]
MGDEFINEEKGIEDLRDIKDILDRADIEYWLDHGSLLGAVRDKRFIPWDNDIDLSTMSTEIDKIIAEIPEIEKRGFKIIVTDFNIEMRRSSVPINIIVMRLKGDAVWTLFSGDGGDSIEGRGIKKQFRTFIRKTYKLLFSNKKIMLVRKFFKMLPAPIQDISYKMVWTVRKRWGKKYTPIVVPKSYYDDLGKISFYGMVFNTPAPVEDYLSLKYGKDWKKPRKEWVFWRDDGAIKEGFDIPEA